MEDYGFITGALNGEGDNRDELLAGLSNVNNISGIYPEEKEVMERCFSYIQEYLVRLTQNLEKVFQGNYSESVYDVRGYTSAWTAGTTDDALDELSDVITPIIIYRWNISPTDLTGSIEYQFDFTERPWSDKTKELNKNFLNKDFIKLIFTDENAASLVRKRFIETTGLDRKIKSLSSDAKNLLGALEYTSLLNDIFTTAEKETKKELELKEEIEEVDIETERKFIETLKADGWKEEAI